jgi:hypothetical protein
MKHTIQQVFHSPNFVIGFAIFMALLLMVIIYLSSNPGYM